MALREVRFGSITLQTNGIDRDIYEPFFANENLPLNGDEHPQNWYAGKLKEIVHAADAPIDNLKAEHIKKIVEESRTRLTEEGIQKINEEALCEQVVRYYQHTLEQTQGFFNDFINAWSYAENLRHVGLHPWSKRVHSDLTVFGAGESSIVSKGGIVYQLKPYICISGLSHDRTFSLELRIPEKLSETEVRGIHDFILNHTWSDGSVIETKTATVSRNNGPFVEEIADFVLTRKDLDTHAQIGVNSKFFSGFGLYGRMRNYEDFCRSVMNELDLHFKTLS